MKHEAGESTSLWMATARRIASEGPLESDMDTDICVVGAGIAGMSTAYGLAREGRRVVVLDSGELGGHMTARTTAHLSNALDERYYELERLHGERGARLAAESHSAAIARIESIVLEEGIDCDFERLDGYLLAPPGDSGQALDEELKATRRAGLRGVAMVDRRNIRGHAKGTSEHPGSCNIS